MCPQCGGELRGHYATSREPHGEDVSEHWFKCVKCGVKVGPDEVAQVCEVTPCTVRATQLCMYCGDLVCSHHFTQVWGSCFRCLSDKYEREEL